jgi:hypothetical protein
MEELKFLSNKNCLVLSYANHDYQEFHVEEFSRYFSKVHLLYYVDFALRNDIQKMENRIRNLVKEKNIDCIILFQWHTYYGLSVQFLAELQKSLTVVLWLFDGEYSFHSFGKYYGQATDLVVTTDYYGKYAYEQLGISSIFYLSSYGKDTYKPLPVKQDIDVSFVGALKYDRGYFLDYLVENGITVQRYGRNSPSGPLSESEMIEIFSRSKINLNFTKFGGEKEFYNDEPLNFRVRQIKGRVVELGLCKAFCLTEASPAIEKLFDVGAELDVFSTAEQLLEKVRFYLEHKVKREDLASNLRKKCLEEYEKDIYLKKIMLRIEEVFKCKKYPLNLSHPIHISPIFKMRESAFLLRNSAYYILRCKFYSSVLSFLRAFKYGFFVCIKGAFYSISRSIKRLLGIY